ncbi:MAG: PAS domain S-box protein [Symploca sp. SIO2E9]|nr:PAS domain S-box protein [Symploca sp. SIO2E9]
MPWGISLDWRCLILGRNRKTQRLLATIIVTILTGMKPTTNIYAQETNIQVEHMTVDDGLSQSAIYSMLRGSQGFMWFGTQDGLNRYDGYDFIVYRHDQSDTDSLSDNWITSIYEDSSGTIWVGTDGGGLNKFNRETEQFTRYLPEADNPNSLGANRVLSIYEDSSGTIWVGTDGGGLNKFNRETEQFTHYKNNQNELNCLSNNTVFSIHQDKLGILWVGTAEGLNQFNPETGQFTHYSNNPNDPQSLSDNTVLSIYEDQFSRLWVGTKNGGLNLFERETEQFTHYQHDPDNPNSLSYKTVGSIAEDRFGHLWLGTSSWQVSSYGRYLDKFDPKTKKFTHYTEDETNPKSLNDTVFNSLLRTEPDILWIGTAFGGINKLDQKNRKFKHYKRDSNNPHSLNDNQVMSIYEDQSGMIWIGTNGSGINRFDPTTNKFTHYQHDPNDPNSLSSDTVWSVYEDRDGMLWIGTFGSGLNKWDRETGQFTHYTQDPGNSNSLSNNTIPSIYEDQSGTLWIGTWEGLNKFNRETGQFTHYTHDPGNSNSLSNNTITSIYEDQSGTLWIGTWEGLNKFNRETGEFTRYTRNPANFNSLSHDRVITIVEYPTGTLWIGTYGGGLNKFDIATEAFTNYTKKDGLPNNSIVGMLVDNDGNLWLSTNKGLSKFNPQTETFRNYDVSDGLQGNEFSGVKAYIKSKTGELFFGGVNGFNSFFPKEVKDSYYLPPIVITDFKVFNESENLDQTITATDKIQLSYKQNFFSFEFAALDYTNPHKNQYAYKLEGFDHKWIYSGHRRYASYTNLDAGTYIFKVKGSNSDGVWNQQGTSLTIIITPPPWKTWWAYTCYVLLPVVIVIGYVQWKIQAQEYENALLRQSERKLKQILEAIPIGIVVVDNSGQSVYVNQTAMHLLGAKATLDGDVEQLSDIYQFYIAGTQQLYPPEKLTLSQALRGKKTTIDDMEVHRQDQIISLEARGTPIYNEHGAVVYAVCAFQDITVRKQAEAERQQYTQELKKAKDQLQAVLDTVPGCVSWMSVDGRYLGTNGHLAKALNLPTEAFVGREVGFFDHKSELSQFLREFLVSPKTTASRVVNVPIKDSIRNYWIGVQKYQQNRAAVGVGIDITEQKLAEEALRKSLTEKEILLQEVHHRVKNNLQVISSLLDLQSYSLKDTKTIELFRESYNRVKSMALVHERLYSSASLEKINFAEYIETLTCHLIQSYELSREPIEIKINCEEVLLNLDKAITCGLIVNELISNALKYAFPQKTGGLVEITLKREGEQLFLTIKDNGVGLPKDLDWQAPPTLGLQLVKILTQQLEGELELEPSQGTEFRIKFS